MSAAPMLEITRVPISVPCEVPVLPGTPDTEAPLEQRTEKCHVDAWWFVGAAPTCDHHLRVVLAIVGDNYDAMLAQFVAEHPEMHVVAPNEQERRPWAEMHRYPQR